MVVPVSSFGETTVNSTSNPKLLICICYLLTSHESKRDYFFTCSQKGADWKSQQVYDASLASLLVSFLGWWKRDLLERLSDLQLRDKRSRLESPGLVMLIYFHCNRHWGSLPPISLPFSFGSFSQWSLLGLFLRWTTWGGLAGPGRRRKWEHVRWRWKLQVCQLFSEMVVICWKTSIVNWHKSPLFWRQRSLPADDLLNKQLVFCFFELILSCRT